MDPKLLEYYNRELLYIREMGGEFANEFPKIAGRLGLDGFECADPYVERLLEGFAFMAARVHLKLDSEFPKFTDNLMEMVYPQYLAPTPSMAIVQFEPDPTEGSLSTGITIDRHTPLRSSMGPGDQTACEYRTSQEVTMWPLAISKAEYTSREAVSARMPERFKDAKAILRVRLASTNDAPISKMPVGNLPIYIRGRDARTMWLYEQLFADTANCVVSWDAPGTSGPNCSVLENPIRPMGFEDHQALLPAVPQSFKGYRLLNEYFAFQQRFLFVDLTGLQKAFAACPAREIDLLFPFRRSQPRLENVVDASNFGLFCTPAINLFPHRADRIHVNESESEYHVVPDRTRPMDFEVHSIVSVTGYDADAEASAEFTPFYEINDSKTLNEATENTFYSIRRTQRQLSSKQRRRGPRSSYIGSEVYLSIVDSANAPFATNLSQLDLSVMCTNRDLPLTMPVGKLSTDFTLGSGKPVKSVRCVAGPTEPKHSFAALPGERTWRLISHLSLNYLSIIDGDGKGISALRELLMLYQDVYEPGAASHAAGLVGVDSKPIVRRLSQRGPLTFGRGLEITLTCDESRFEGSGAFLLGALLSDFFSKYVSINSFTQTVLRTIDRGEVMRWPIKLGRRQIL